MKPIYYKDSIGIVYKMIGIDVFMYQEKFKIWNDFCSKEEFMCNELKNFWNIKRIAEEEVFLEML